MADYSAGLYSAGGRQPNIEQRGNWMNPNGKGRTVYIGVRTNGKFLRVYEKGRQLGDENSEWVISNKIMSCTLFSRLPMSLVSGNKLVITRDADTHFFGEVGLSKAITYNTVRIRGATSGCTFA